MVSIYILLLEDNKYYVGKTNSLVVRLSDHFEGKGSVWTTKYKPLRIEKIIKDCDNFAEDKYTLKWMKKYGIENVRGGSFCRITLPKSELTVIKKMINSMRDSCYKCGKKGHFAKDCGVTYPDPVYEEPKRNVPKMDPNATCVRCYRKGHWRKNCYAETMKGGKRPIGWHCWKCGSGDHWFWKCKSKKDIFGNIITSSKACVIC